jgi:uncharacterized protein YlxW (UPF0749 family)
MNDVPGRQDSPATSAALSAAAAWRRVRQAARPKISRAQLVVAVLVGTLGFALVAQVTRDHGQDLAGLRQNELVQVLSNIGEQRDRLAAERADLEAEQRSLANGNSGSEAAIAAAQERLDALSVLAGTVEAQGPGLEITLTNSAGKVPVLPVLGLVQELREAGAEAIQIGSARVVASTAFTQVDGAVAVDDLPQTSPLRILVIGDGQTMSTALHIPGGVLESLPAGTTGNDVITAMVKVTALRPVPRPQFARPGPDSSGNSR